MLFPRTSLLYCRLVTRGQRGLLHLLMGRGLRYKAKRNAVLSGLLGAVCIGSCTEENPFLYTCGNNVLNEGEECDEGSANGEGFCTIDCKKLGCGNRVLDEPEQCDLGANNSDQGACTLFCTLATCGDGFVYTDEEQCDDGPDNKDTPDGMGGCSSNCLLLSTCGDGQLDPEHEDCDDGNLEDGDDCPSNCRFPFCGDGVIDPGETCDDGNLDDSDACPGTCQPATCGDGYVYKGSEDCDDGNQDNSDACLTACVAAKCGDGVLHEGVEECDDGNDIPDDGCDEQCIRDRLVFLTEEDLAPPGFNSLYGADNLCRKTAMNYGYANFQNFKAWLSDDKKSPADRFFHSSGRYVMVTGEVVAENWDDLTDGTLQNGINRTLSGMLLDMYPVWTATQPNGESWGDGENCENWTSNAGELTTRQGSAGFTDTWWTNDEWQTICGDGGLLYCFEQ